ncbi:MAG: adenylate/guanylate cyclase domain-containing protein [Deltaproteobacteria bacterium]|nr:adenylate/guanylate cyclase domain-containing protein [Deltaproteobacteria bacterium]
MTRYRRLLLVQLPLIALWTCAFLIARCGDEGTLGNDFLRTSIYPTLRRMEGTYTDLKFHARGAAPVANKIVIVAIDDDAVSKFARWPWHRDAIAALILTAADAGAKVVGLDIVFPEADQRVPDGVAELLTANNLGDQIPSFETDLMLQRIIDVYKDRLVLGWMTDEWCRPAYEDTKTCDVAGKDALAALPAGFAKFALQVFTPAGAFDAAASPLVSAPGLVGNLPGYTESATHAGFLVNATDDPDDVVRRAQVVMMVGGRPHPSLPLEMARIGLGEDLELALDGDGFVDRVAFARSKRELPVDASGALAINFRGAGYHFAFVSAYDLIAGEETVPVQQDGAITQRAPAELFKDAYVLIGVTAAGARDLKHFPFGSNIPGTEGLATILDNILAGDPLTTTAPGLGTVAMLLLMTVGGAAFGLLMLRLPALPAMLTSIGIIGVLALLDIYWLFGQLDVDLRSVFLLAELATIFVATVAVKYVVEERGKRFIRSTFSKYLAPTVVDQMLRDPSKMRLGGETRRLTIMMSDLRGFTAMAERMKPHEVLGVLNHYLGAMADIIVEYGGTIDEFIGDAILVIFGAPIEAPDDARRAVACAIAMQRAMGPINAHNAKLGLPKLEMGIALNTGEVIVGNIGSDKHVKYGVVGSHVNLTARIESNTVGGQVLIAGTTLDLAGPDVKVGEKQLIVAKGFPEPIPAFEIKGIGGEYKLDLDELDLGLVDLATPLEVRFRVMKGKNEEGDEQVGRFTALSELGAAMTADGVLEPFSNLKLRVLIDSALLDGDLYAKVIGSGAAQRLRFTAVPPAVARAIAAQVAPVESQRSSELAERS